MQTVDFFPPVVDDPYTFGQIAAANALSDVYAMGGTPLTALNIVAFPVCTLAPEVLGKILKGGAEKVKEAGAFVVGGHTVEDQEPKYGLAVTGIVHPQALLKKQGGEQGDSLVLTKPLGTGVITTALKAKIAPLEAERAAIESMQALNQAAAAALKERKVHACTDVTGFGLLGHALEMIMGTKVGIELNFHALPLLPGVLELAQMGLLPAGAYRNKEHFDKYVLWEEKVPEAGRDLLFDPQTSGGLLVALPKEEERAYLEALAARGVRGVVVGQITTHHPGRIQVKEE